MSTVGIGRVKDLRTIPSPEREFQVGRIVQPHKGLLGSVGITHFTSQWAPLGVFLLVPYGTSSKLALLAGARLPPSPSGMILQAEFWVLMPALHFLGRSFPNPT